MSMLWMRMPGETWPGAAASFLGMWLAMMVPMMVPTIAPVLWRYWRAVGLRTLLVAAGYFVVWGTIGLALYPLGVALASVEMGYPALARVAPFAVAFVVCVAGTWQLTRWKAHSLACCRQAFDMGGGEPRLDAYEAWRRGLRLGIHCARCCGNLMAILLALGMTDVRAMVIVGTAIAVERVAPMGERIAHVTGLIAVGGGMALIARAAGLG